METLKKQTDCTPRYLLTHKELVEKMAVYLEGIHKASQRLNERVKMRDHIFYNYHTDEKNIESAEAALNRLISRYRDLFFEFRDFQFTYPIYNTRKKDLQF